MLARALALLLALVAVACGRPEGPRAIVWDREPCAHCHMLISDPSFAAQLETRNGDLPAFDDPGCLLAYLSQHRDTVRRIWFHHMKEDRWIPGDRVAFVRVPRTPMGYGLGAVDAGTPGSISLDQAQALVAAHDAQPPAPHAHPPETPQ
jgi:copper chaperone NosL